MTTSCLIATAVPPTGTDFEVDLLGMRRRSHATMCISHRQRAWDHSESIVRAVAVLGALAFFWLALAEFAQAELATVPRIPTLEMSELYVEPEALSRHRASETLFYIAIGLDFATTAYGILELDLKEGGPLHSSFGKDALVSAVIVDGLLMWLRCWLGKKYQKWPYWSSIDWPHVAVGYYVEIYRSCAR